MKKQISRFILTTLLVTLFLLALIPRTSAMNKSFMVTNNFSEDFTTTTYRDLGQTSAWGWGTGTVTNSRNYLVQLLDSYLTSGEVTSIDIQGRKLYASINNSIGLNTFEVLNITDPWNIQQMSIQGGWARQRPVVVAGDIAALGGGVTPMAGVGLYNITNPYSPIIGMAIFLDGNVTDLEFQGHFLYIANSNSPSSLCFRIVDVENPNAPILLPMGYLSPQVNGLTVDGHFAYLAEGSAGMTIMNITAPALSFPVDTVNTPGNAIDVIVDGNLAFVADGSSGVQIIDVSNPSSANIIGNFDTAGDARRLALQGDTLFVADGSNGLVVLDVTDPTRPLLIDTITISYAWDVDLYGEIVCIAGAAGIYTYKIGLGLAMLPLIGVWNGGTQVKDVRVQGDVAYIAAGSDGFITVDVSDPANPVLLDQYTSGVTDTIKLDIQGHIAVVSDTSAVHVFNVLDPSNIQLYQSIPATGLMDIFLWGELFFYSFGGMLGGAGWVNISNPYIWTNYQINFGTNITAIWVQGHHLYAVDDIGGFGISFYIYDIADLNNWVQIESVSRVGYHYDIFVDGDVAYFADDAPGFGYASIYNVTNPSSTYLADDIFNDTLGVWAYGPWLVTADQIQGVSLHNTTDFHASYPLVTQTTVNGARAVTLHGNYAYVANSTTLAILQLVRAAGNTYIPGTNSATSVDIDSTIETIVNATLTYSAIEPIGTSIAFEMSVDGGTNWETVTPGLKHTFANTGSDLRWRAQLTTTFGDRSIRLHMVSIDYEYPAPITTPPPPPIPGFPIEAIALGAIIALGLGLLYRRERQKAN